MPEKWTKFFSQIKRILNSTHQYIPDMFTPVADLIFLERRASALCKTQFTEKLS
jgi:hypothetical protein